MLQAEHWLGAHVQTGVVTARVRPSCMRTATVVDAQDMFKEESPRSGAAAASESTQIAIPQQLNGISSTRTVSLEAAADASPDHTESSAHVRIPPTDLPSTSQPNSSHGPVTERAYATVS